MVRRMAGRTEWISTAGSPSVPRETVAGGRLDFEPEQASVVAAHAVAFAQPLPELHTNAVEVPPDLEAVALEVPRSRRGDDEISEPAP